MARIQSRRETVALLTASMGLAFLPAIAFAQDKSEKTDKPTKEKKAKKQKKSKKELGKKGAGKTDDRAGKRKDTEEGRAEKRQSK